MNTLIFRLGLVLLCCSVAPLQADQFGLFTYSVVGGTTVEITAYPTSVDGPVIIPEAINRLPVTSIGQMAFAYCTGLTSVTIPSSVTTIGSRAFFLCTGLTSVTIPSSVTRIGEWAFAQCAGLTSVTIPSSVTTIGDFLFFFCTGLTSATLQEGLTTIGYDMFAGCGLTSITIPASITSIGGGAFSHCTGLTNVTLPQGLSQIGETMFSGCSALTSLTLPASVTSIGGGAFGHCAGLTSITIPASVTSIGEAAFSDCTGLESIIVEPGNSQYASAGGVLFNTMLTTLIVYPAGKAGAYSISPGVTTIGDFALYTCTGLTSVTIPASVTSIGSNAFLECTALESIIVEPGNLQYASAGGVLFDIMQTTLIQYPAGKAGVYLISSGVASIGAFAFSECGGLTSVTIPSSVTTIGGYAFAGCAGLTSVTIPSSVTSMGMAFYGCSGLTSVTFQQGLTTIGYWAFLGCTGLASITIPSSVASIGDEAFGSCHSLASVLFLGDAPVLEGGSNVFRYTAPELTLYYPSSRTGFTSPTWYSHPAIMIDLAIYPAGIWLKIHGYPHDTRLSQDPNGDGVALLMAYALDLDPRLNLQSSLPKPVLGANTLNLTFHATSPGITYRVETSTDLRNWVISGVTRTVPGPDQRSTATVSRDATHRFLRLKVSSQK